MTAVNPTSVQLNYRYREQALLPQLDRRTTGRARSAIRPPREQALLPQLDRRTTGRARSAIRPPREQALLPQLDRRTTGRARSAIRPPREQALLTQLDRRTRSVVHTSELQPLMRISYAVFCLKKKKKE